jgi:hypothetical protein
MDLAATPLLFAINQVSHMCNFRTLDVVAIIKHYARRNEMVHASFEDIIRKENFHDLTTIIYEDLCDISRIFGIDTT